MNSDPAWATVNWIHLSDAEALTIQRIGVRYRLHPLVVEDLVYRENRAKIDKYKTHMLITIPIMQYREYNDSDYKFYFSNYTNYKHCQVQDIDSILTCIRHRLY